jgi:hypothetical protein
MVLVVSETMNEAELIGRRWALATFGAQGVYIRRRIPELVRAEHIASADAQEASGHRSRGVYGEYWRGILEKFETFASLPGAQLVRPGEAPYKIPVIQGVALYPWRYSRDPNGDLVNTPFVTSDARGTIFQLPISFQPELNLALPDPDLTAEEQTLAAMIEAARAESDQIIRKVVVVAVSSSSIALHDVQWGEATGFEKLCLKWGFREGLMNVGIAGPAGLANPAATFTSGEPPSTGVRPHSEDEADSGRYESDDE